MTGTSSGQLEELERWARRLAVAARRDRPRHAGRGQVGQQLARARQRSDLGRTFGVRLGVQAPELARLLVGHLATGLAQQGVREQAAAHPDLAVDPPDGQVDPGAVERDPPRQDVLVHAVDERAVEVEEEPLGPIHDAMLRAGGSAAPVVPSDRARCYTRAVS